MKKFLKFNFMAILMIVVAGCTQSTNKNVNVDADVNDSAGGFITAEKAAVKINTADGTIFYYTHDTKNQKLRMDMTDGIFLMDYKNKTMWAYVGMWMNIPWNSSMASENYFEMTAEESIAKQGFTKSGTMTVLGKLCDIYVSNDLATNVETKSAIWNGITMWVEKDGIVIWEALAVTLDVPDNFFEQSTLSHSWIE
jgi:hypothetical protein